ncbi:hypothetical protein ACOSQ2_022552 [Xanthoceras sorbifolium]
MNSGENISDFFSRTMAIVNKIHIHGEKIEDMTVVEKILRSLSPKFNYVVCSIEESKDLDILSIDELQGSLLEEAEVEIEDTMTVDNNQKLIITKFMILQVEDKDDAVTISPFIDQGQTSLIKSRRRNCLTLNGMP